MIEAPVKEPRDLQGPVGVEVQVVSRTFRSRRGEVTALQDVSMSAGPGEIVAVVGPSGCGKSTLLELICGLQTPDAGIVAAAPAALMPQRDLLLPWLTAVDNAALALRAKGIRRDRARASAATVARALRTGRVRAVSSGRAVGRHAPARLVSAHAAGRQAGARARRAVRFAGRDNSQRDAGVARPRARGRAAHGRARHPRRRGGGDARRPRAGDVAAARPGRGRARGRAPRPRRRTDPAIVGLRERALETLGVGE